MNAEEAVRLARLAASAGLPTWVKLEIHPDPHYLLPDPIETPQGRGDSGKGRFYRTAVHQCRSCPGQAAAGRGHGDCHAARLADREQPRNRHARADRDHRAPGHGSRGRGRRNRRAQHAAEAFELGADAVLVNTAIAAAADPVRMARAFKTTVEAAREAVEAGLPTKLDHAEATSPLAAFLKSQ